MSLAVLVLSSPAWGQPNDKARAKAHYQKAKAAFKQGQYEEALKQYQQAYKHAPLPGFLFNIGQCHRNMGQNREAVAAFQLYLEKLPEARNRAAVETLIQELEQQLQAQPEPEPRPEPEPARPGGVPEYQPDPPTEPGPGAITRTPDPPPPRPTTSRPFYKQWWFWTAVGAVAAGGAVGIYFGTRPQDAEIPSTALGVLNFSR